MTSYFWMALTANGNKFLGLVVPAALKATFLRAFVSLLCKVFRRFSAATRHCFGLPHCAPRFCCLVYHL